MFCESTEQIIWAVNNDAKKAKNWTFNYNILKENNIKKCSKCDVELDFEYKFCPYCSGTDFEIVKRQMRNMWDVPIISKSEKNFGNHPSQKPISIINRLILGCTNEDDMIIDPFTGSGTIPLVAMLCKRKFVAIKKEETFCDIAYNRINNSIDLLV